VLERFAAVDLQDGRIELQDAKGEAWLVIDGVDGTMLERGGRRSIRLAMKNGAAGPPRRRLAPIEGRADGTIARGGSSSKPCAGGTRLDARRAGRARSRLTDRVVGDLRADADGALASVAGTKLSGRVRGQAHLVATKTLTARCVSRHPS